MESGQEQSPQPSFPLPTLNIVPQQKPKMQSCMIVFLIGLAIITLLAVGGIFLLILSIGSFILKNETPLKKTTISPKQPTKTGATSTNKKIIKINLNQPATLENQIFTVTSVERNFAPGKYDSVEKGKEVVVVTINIENTSESNINYSSLDFKMQDKTGDQKNYIYVSTIKNRLEYGTLIPKAVKEGMLAFAVPQDDTTLKLVYTPFFAEETVVVSISNSDESSLSSTPSAVPTKSPFGTDQLPAHIGQIVTLENKNMEVLIVQRPYQATDSAALLVTIRIENTDAAPLWYNAPDFTLVSETGDEYAIDRSLTIPNRLESGTIAENEKKTGNILFLVQETNKKLTLIYEPYSKNERAVFDLTQ